jgi:hypothetical protein
MLVTNPPSGSVPRAMLTLPQYVERRVDGQIDYYKKHADSYRTTATRLR